MKQKLDKDKLITNLERQVELLTQNNEDQARKIHDLVNELHRIKGEAEGRVVDSGQVELLKQDLKELTEVLKAKDNRIDRYLSATLYYGRMLKIIKATVNGITIPGEDTIHIGEVSNRLNG